MRSITISVAKGEISCRRCLASHASHDLKSLLAWRDMHVCKPKKTETVTGG